jgi:peptidyl-prolyl cis-trans isomerase SurA
MHPKSLLRAGLFTVALCGPVLPTLLNAADVPTAASPTQNVKVVEMIVAKVNGEIITQTELEHQRAVIQAELQKDVTIPQDKLATEVSQKQADALRGKIDELLLTQKAKEESISVDAEVTKRLAQLQADSKKADPEEFHRWIQENAGIPFEDFKSQMRDHLLTQKLVSQEVAYKINIPQSEIKAYYEQHKADFVREEQVFLREILIAPKSNSPADVAAAEKKAKEICARARKGEKFAELARSYSDAATAQQDGELGAYKKGQLLKPIEDAVFAQNRGYVTDPIRTSGGFEILKVEERYQAGQAALEDVQNEIMDKLYAPRMEPELRKYLTKLRDDAFIEIRGGWVDSGAAPGKDTTWKDPATIQPETTTKAQVQAQKKKRILGVIPRHSSSVSSSDPGSSGKSTPATAPATAPPASGSSSSSSSSSPS